MDARMRWRLAVPLIGLSPADGRPRHRRNLGVLVGVRETYRALSVAVCVLLLAQWGLAASIGVRPARDVPWLRIAMIALAFVLACGVAAVRGSL